MIGIYKITNLLNGESYIGKSVNIKRRFAEHKIGKGHKNSLIKKAIEYFGVSNFKFEVLEECAREMMPQKEKHYIKLHKPEYNRTSGGDGRNRSLTKEEKEVLRKHGKARWELLTSEEKEHRINNNLKGPRVGHSVSKETREKLRQANLGKKQSKETIEKRKRTIKKSGYIQTNQGHRKKVICIETGEIFNSVKEASEKHGLTSLSAHLKGRHKTCKGNHYKYV